MFECVLCVYVSAKSHLLASHWQAASYGNAQPCHDLGNAGHENLQGKRHAHSQTRIELLGAGELCCADPRAYGALEVPQETEEEVQLP